MIEQLEDTWNSRELPVLRETARLLELADFRVGVYLHQIVEATGMDAGSVHRSIRILRDAGHLELHETNMIARGRVVRISPEARMMVGQWPSEESALERLVAALEAVAASPDVEPEERTKAKSFAKWLGSSATTVGTTVAAAVLTGQIPR